MSIFFLPVCVVIEIQPLLWEPWSLVHPLGGVF